MMKSLFRKIAAAAFCCAVPVLFSACGEDGKAAPAPEKPAEKTKPQESRIVVNENAVVRPQGHLSDLSFDAVPSKPEPLPEVHVTTDHILRMSPEDAEQRAAVNMPKKSVWKIVSATPDGSSAAQLTDLKNSKIRLIWTPLECSSSLDPVRIPDVVISPDKSVILFLETTGDAGGPLGSRIVMMNTHDWHFLRIAELPGRFISRLAWIPGTTSVAALCKPQKIMKQPAGIAVFNLISGKETAFAEVPEDAGKTAFLADGKGHVLLSRTEKPELLALDEKTLQPVPASPVAAPAPNAIAALSPDGKFIAVSADCAKTIDVIKTGDLQFLNQAVMPEHFPLAQIHFLPMDGKFFPFYLCGKASYAVENVLLTPGGNRKLKGNASGLGALSDDGQTLYNAKREQNGISVIDVSSGSEVQNIDVNRAQPKLNQPGPGTVRFLFLIPHAKAAALFDTQGNFYLISLERSKKKNAERATIFQRGK